MWRCDARQRGKRDLFVEPPDVVVQPHFVGVPDELIEAPVDVAAALAIILLWSRSLDLAWRWCRRRPTRLRCAAACRRCWHSSIQLYVCLASKV